MTTKFMVSPAQPERAVEVNDDEVRRVLAAMGASGFTVVLTCEMQDDGWALDAVCSNAGIVSQMFPEIN